LTTENNDSTDVKFPARPYVSILKSLISIYPLQRIQYDNTSPRHQRRTSTRVWKSKRYIYRRWHGAEVHGARHLFGRAAALIIHGAGKAVENVGWREMPEHAMACKM